jgi:hypothetical protein
VPFLPDKCSSPESIDRNKVREIRTVEAKIAYHRKNSIHLQTKQTVQYENANSHTHNPARPDTVQDEQIPEHRPMHAPLQQLHGFERRGEISAQPEQRYPRER